MVYVYFLGSTWSATKKAMIASTPIASVDTTVWTLVGPSARGLRGRQSCETALLAGKHQTVRFNLAAGTIISLKRKVNNFEKRGSQGNVIVKFAPRLRIARMEMQMKSKIIAMLFLLSITGVFNVLGETEDDSTIPTKEISKYKSWLKVTPRPHEVKLTLDGLG